MGQELNCVHPETSQYMELDAKSNRARWAKIKKLYEQWDTQLISNVDTVTADWQLSAMSSIKPGDEPYFELKCETEMWDWCNLFII